MILTTPKMRLDATSNKMHLNSRRRKERNYRTLISKIYALEGSYLIGCLLLDIHGVQLSGVNFS